jgi:hypothetical protein
MTDTLPAYTNPIDWDMLVDSDGYPSDYALEVVSSFHGSPCQLVEMLQRLWYPAEDYIEVKLPWRGTVEVRFVTCGWSGNEALISALEQTMFHFRWWEMDKRGGLHVFKVTATDWDTPSDLGEVGKPSVYRMP